MINVKAQQVSKFDPFPLQKNWFCEHIRRQVRSLLVSHFPVLGFAFEELPKTRRPKSQMSRSPTPVRIPQDTQCTRVIPINHLSNTSSTAHGPCMTFKSASADFNMVVASQYPTSSDSAVLMV